MQQRWSISYNPDRVSPKIGFLQNTKRGFSRWASMEAVCIHTKGVGSERLGSRSVEKNMKSNLSAAELL